MENIQLIRAPDLCAYAQKAVGGGYCYGSSGEICTLARRREWAQWNPSQAGNILSVCAKWDGRPVWDCSGLFRGAWRALHKYKSGGATTIYNTWCDERGKISTMPDMAGIAVFRGTEITKEHIGLYIGGGMVVDARSASKGVVCGVKSSYPWTHWGALADVAYSEKETADVEALYKAKVIGVSIGLNLRTSPKNEGNTIMLLPRDTVVELIIEDQDDGFAYVRAGEVYGYCTQSYLRRVSSA